jgi:glycosyltransferase involved in cell wall biosynthesis
LRAVSVVVPVYNSEETIEELCNRVQEVGRKTGVDFQMILVNDGSRDRSWDAICRAAERHPSVRGINLMRNFGQHNALLCGIRVAAADTIVTIDDDLQHPPEEIPRLLAELDGPYDVVYGTPLTEQHGLWRDLASHIVKLALQSAMGAETARRVSAFRAFRTALRDAFQNYEGAFVSLDVLLTWGTTRFTSIPVAHEKRKVGVSNYTFRKLATHALNMMTGFSVLPLQLASLIGFGMTVFGILTLAYVLVKLAIYGSAVPGFAFLASIVSIFSGAQMFALGIMGEYLARMHFRSMQRPTYVIRDRT